MENKTVRYCCTKGGCPFAHTEESDYIQNLGCLPTNYDIISMRYHYNKTWACHSNPSKPCLGGIRRLKELGFDWKVVDNELLTEGSEWHLYTKIDKDFEEMLRKLDYECVVKRLKQNKNTLLQDLK